MTRQISFHPNLNPFRFFVRSNGSFAQIQLDEIPSGRFDRLLFSLLSIVTSSLCLSTFFSVQYFTSLSQTHELSKLRRENRELQTANEGFSKSVAALTSFMPGSSQRS